MTKVVDLDLIQTKCEVLSEEGIRLTMHTRDMRFGAFTWITQGELIHHEEAISIAVLRIETQIYQCMMGMKAS